METSGASGAKNPGDPRSRPPGSPAPEEDDWRARDRRVRLKVVALIILLVISYLLPSILYNVFPGEAAVIWYRLPGLRHAAGTDIDDVRGEGLRAKWPWNKVYIYDIRLRQETRTFPVLATDGLPVEVEVSIRFRLHKEALGKLHKHLGMDYVEKLILPELGSHVRSRIAEYRPAALYADVRKRVEEQILADLRKGLQLDYEAEAGADEGPRELAIHVEDVLIRNIVLPPIVAEAIEDKLAQEQRMLEYDYRLEKEEKERLRKKIEAQGIRDFQDIVNVGISERYLKWKGIDATLELARSPNAKIVVIGAGEDGLPIILGGLDSLPNVLPPASPPPASAGPSSSAPPASTAPPSDLPP